MLLADVTFIDELKMFIEKYRILYYDISKVYFVTILLGIVANVIKTRAQEGPQSQKYILIKNNAIRAAKFSTLIYVPSIVLFTIFGIVMVFHQKFLYNSIKENMNISDVQNILGAPVADLSKNTLGSMINSLVLDTSSFSHAVSQELQGGRSAAQATKEYYEKKRRYKFSKWTSDVLNTYITVVYYREKVSSKSRLGPNNFFLESDDFGNRNTETAEEKEKQGIIRFEKYSNGVIIDKRTNLKWLEDPNGNFFSWAGAKKWAESLTVDNGGWRLPTLNELATIYMSGVVEGYCGKNKYTFYVDGKIFSPHCWTMWAADSNSSQAAYFYFGFANQFLDSNPKIDYAVKQYSGWISKNKIGNNAIAVKKGN